MIGYTLYGSNQYEKALAYYDDLLGVIGGKRIMDFGSAVVYGFAKAGPAFGVTKPYDGQPATCGNGTMIALQMDSKDQVHTLYDKAISLGSKDEGPAGPRGDNFYAGYFRDLDGNKLCAFWSPQM